MSTSLFPSRVESERLRFEPLHDALTPLDLYEYHASGELAPVMRPLHERPHATPKESADELAAAAEAWEAGDRATYAIESREDDEFVGVAELWLEWEKRATSFGIWLREPFWGRGYAAERAGAMLVIAFDVLDLEIVRVGYEPDNERSQSAVERYVDAYGGQFDGLVRNWLPAGDDGEGPHDLRIHSISQAEWRDAVDPAELASIAVERP